MRGVESTLIERIYKNVFFFIYKKILNMVLDMVLSMLIKSNLINFSIIYKIGIPFFPSTPCSFKKASNSVTVLFIFFILFESLINFSPKSLSFSHCLLSSSITQSFEFISLSD